MSIHRVARIRLGALAFMVSGILFVLYPAIRPFSDETSMQGAAAFASNAWMAAHMLGMFAFTLLAVGMLGFYFAVQGTPVEALGYWALVIGIIGSCLTLPFYGGEANGLHAIGWEALRQQNTSLVGMASVVRSGPGLVMFLIGLILLAVSGFIIVIALWKSGRKWNGIPFAVGLGLYIPQFFGTQPLRVIHGLLLCLGCLWIAIGLLRESRMR